MPLPLKLQFEELLTDVGLTKWKNQIQQVIGNPSPSAVIVFEHFKQQFGSQDSFEIPVSISDLTDKFRIEWSQAAEGLTSPMFILNTFVSRLEEFKVEINQAGTQLIDLKMELESTIEAFKDAASGQAAKIPFRVSIENESGIRRFRVEQKPESTPLQITLGGFNASISNSLIIFTKEELEYLSLNAEVKIPHMLNSQGEPVVTTCDVTFDGTLFDFQGRDFVPAPIGFGTITLNKARFKINTQTEVVTDSEWKGLIDFPFFDNGSLEFDLEYNNTTDILTLRVENSDDRPLKKGDISLVLKPFSMVFKNGILDDIIGNGTMSLPLITGEQPLEVEVLYTNIDSKLIIKVSNFHAPKIAGSELDFSRIEFVFVNGSFNGANIDGRLKLPNATGGNGIGFIMTIAQESEEITFSLNPEMAPNTIEFGPVELDFNILNIIILHNALTTFNAAGMMTLPAVDDPFAFTIDFDETVSPGQYTVTINELKSNLGVFEMEVVNFILQTQAGAEPQITSDGRLWLPVFSSGDGILYDFSIISNDTYRITTRAESELIAFGGFQLSNLNLEVNVAAGIIQNYLGSGELKIPGIDTPFQIQVNYNGTTITHSISLLSPVNDIPLFGCETDLITFNLELANKTFSSGNGTGNLRLPGSSSQGLSYAISVNNQGDYDILVAGNDEKLDFRVVELIIPTPGFAMQVRNGILQNAAGHGIIVFPGLTSVSPLQAAFSINGSGNPVSYGWMARLEDASGSIAGFELHFGVAQVGVEPDGNFSADISGKMHLPVFNDGVGFDFTISIPDNNSYKVGIEQNVGKATFGGFEIDDLEMELEVLNSELQDFNGQARLLVPCFSDPFQVAMAYQKSNSSNQKELAIALPSGTPEIPIFGGMVQFNSFKFTILNGSFGACNGKGILQLPSAIGSGGIGFDFDMKQADGGNSYRLKLDSEPSAPAELDFSVLKLSLTQFELEVKNQKFENATAEGQILINALSDSNLNFFLNATKPESSSDDISYYIAGSGNANLNDFLLAFNNFAFKIEKDAASGSAALRNFNITGEMTIPACETPNDKLAFLFDIDKDENKYTIELNQGDSTTKLDLGPVKLELNNFLLTIRNGSVDNLIGSAGLTMDGLDNGSGTPANIAATFGYESNGGKYTVGMESSSVDVSLGGFTLKLKSLQLSFTATDMDWPFRFTGGLMIPGLKDSNQQPAEIEIEVSVNSGGQFVVSSNSDAEFRMGSLKVSDLSVEITKEGNDLKVNIEGQLTIEGLGGEAKTIKVGINIQSDGSFVIRGEKTPAIKLLDVPSVARLYLSMIQLSRINNEWGFSMGGKVENLIVIPGMDNLLPKEVNIRELDFTESVGLDFGVTWPSGLSIDFGGNEPGDVLVPVNGKFGNAVSLDALKISYGNISDTPVKVGVLFMGAALKLGPVSAAVEGLGINLELEKRDPYQNAGNFGVVDIRTTFVPPAGLGIALNTPVFTGGGYLYHNQGAGEYAGAVELSFMGMFDVSAIGVINNKMPDGRPGTSVLFIMSVEFTPGITLGFGFFLNGLGGIIGIHRTMDVERLRDGVKTGTIKNILFPKNILPNISRIISDIKDLFPIKRDQFIIGPLAAITWGVPTVIRIDMGLALEFGSPDRFGIFGVLRVILPDERAALIRIQVAFLGIVDFEKGMLSFDASLFDSKILTFGLEGDMALRLSWGREKDFVLSVGGFHPRYTPPAHLHIPPMKRLTVKLLTGNPRLTLTSYFAVTTNTVQFGAGIDFHFSISKFKVVGEFGFDVLFQFSPFRFIADAHARLAVKWGRRTLLGISLQFTLEGPAPWRAHGTASFKVLFISCKVKIDRTWGDKKDTSLPNIAVLPILLEALYDNRNWRSVSGAHGVPGVRMKSIGATDDLILTPGGIIEITQKVVPLKRTIGKFGQYEPADYSRFEFKPPKIGGQNAANQDTTDVFAPANFMKVDDKEKLHLPSFEKHPAGIRIRPQGSTFTCGSGFNRELAYYEVLVDRGHTIPIQDDNATLPPTIATFMMTHGAIRKSPFSSRRKLYVNKTKVKVMEPEYAVVDTGNLQQVGTTTYSSYIEAHEAMAGNSNLQIVPIDVLNNQ